MRKYYIVKKKIANPSIFIPSSTIIRLYVSTILRLDYSTNNPIIGKNFYNYYRREY